MDKPIKKINFVYLLCTIFVPLMLVSLGLTVGYFLFHDGGVGAVICFLVPPVLAFVWWCFGGRLLYKHHCKKMARELDERGFRRNHTFESGGATVMVDLNRGELGLVFFWNPFEHYVLPAKRIQRAWVDDGAAGGGFLRGSSRVSFLFQVDGVKIRVDTFTSNKRWRMDSDYILTGISKADVMVEVLEQAKQRSA